MAENIIIKKPPQQPQKGLEVKEDSIIVSNSANTLRFTGNIVSTSVSGTEVTIEVSSASQQDAFILFTDNDGITQTINTPVSIQIAVTSNFIDSIYQIVSNDTVAINQSGIYRITYSITAITNSNFSTRTVSQFYLLVNGVTARNSFSYGFHGLSANGFNTIMKQIIISANTGTRINLIGKRNSGSVIVTEQNQCILIIERIK